MNTPISDGYLGIRCPELQAYGNQNLARIIKHYESLAKSPRGEKIALSIGGDPRVKGLSKKLIANGFEYRPFDAESLIAWFLWRCDNCGERQARTDLEEYLDAEFIPCLVVIELLGITVSQVVSLFDDYYLYPFEEIPEYFGKYLFRDPFTSFRLNGNVSMAALVKKVFIPKTHEPTEDDSPPLCESLVSELLDAMPLVNMLTLLRGSCVQANSHTFLHPDKIPFGFFLRGSSCTLLPCTHSSFCSPYEYKTTDSETIRALFTSFRTKSEKEQEVILRILHRLSQAKNRQFIDDKILDLGITLEMLLLNDLEKDELAYRFALRCAYYLESNPTDRSKRFKEMKEFYSLRSDVAHNGRIKENKFEVASRNIERYIETAEQVCTRVIIQGWPNWNTLTLGG